LASANQESGRISKEPLDPIDMKSLRCFEMMARHGSLTRAGIELGIADAAVSQCIKSLERYLETKLYQARGHTLYQLDRPMR